jgi:thiol-disulfide isomerase/thioredoxin
MFWQKITKITLIALFFFLSALPSAYAEEKQEIIDLEKSILFFWSNGCPHCAQEKPFLEKLVEKYPSLKFYSLEISKKENAQLLAKVGEELNTEIPGVPFTVIGKKYFVGWRDENTSGKAMEEAAQEILGNQQNGEVSAKEDKETEIAETFSSKSELPTDSTSANSDINQIPKTIKVPLLGEIEIKNFSLPVITIILGALDGFNPCAMWALLFLISLLLGMKDKKRMWIFGSVFIVVSGMVYFLFMAAWLNLILFIGIILWARIIIGLIAIGGGSYNLKEFFYNKESRCKMTGGERKRKFFNHLREATQKKQFWLALGGIIILAVTVNLVEMVCSAGLPVIYTQTLALSNLAKWQYYLYLCFYIFIFILDDLFIFFTAMFTLKITGATTKYTRISRLIGGLLMIIIGILLIFKPGLLMFN